MDVTGFELRLPQWLVERISATSRAFETVEARMAFVLELARANVERGTGGPFAAAVFDVGSARLVSAGVNLVVSSGLSIAHAEVVALSLAQRAFGALDLSLARLQLVSSAEPCWMCLGAIHWTGVRSLVSAARDADVRAIGFDEGHKPADWAAELRKQGIEVTCDVERAGAIAVLADYRARGGRIYNAGG
jgi:tRNA(Arg) A34 adenosine deaminase TadA